MIMIPQLKIKDKIPNYPLDFSNLFYPVCVNGDKIQFIEFNEKLIIIPQRIIHINKYVQNLFKSFEVISLNEVDQNNKLNENILLMKQSHYNEIKLVTEEIIYWIRKTIDEFISIIYILNNPSTKKIKIDSIGKLLHLKTDEDKRIFNCIIQKHESFLNIINDISNFYKHSFLNTKSNVVFNPHNPSVIAINYKLNDYSSENSYKEHDYDIKLIIECSNNLIDDLIKVCENVKD